MCRRCRRRMAPGRRPRTLCPRTCRPRCRRCRPCKSRCSRGLRSRSSGDKHRPCSRCHRRTRAVYLPRTRRRHICRLSCTDPRRRTRRRWPRSCSRCRRRTHHRCMDCRRRTPAPARRCTCRPRRRRLWCTHRRHHKRLCSVSSYTRSWNHSCRRYIPPHHRIAGAPPPAQDAAAQVSPVVHASLSSQSASLGSASHPLVASQASSVHGLSSSHLTAVPTHCPDWQVSLAVHASPSSHAAARGGWVQARSTTRSSVQGLPSSGHSTVLGVALAGVASSPPQPPAIAITVRAASWA